MTTRRTANQIAHDELMRDLGKARAEALGETRTLLRRASERLKRLNDIVNNIKARGIEIDVDE